MFNRENPQNSETQNGLRRGLDFIALPFLPWRLKVEIKRIYEIADHALAPPQFFGKTVNPISTKGADCAH